ncbi:mPR-like GPCR protein [Xylogone sp. PMI_703]|nr:mPR-like GPCR protein [Xylogone sp. PMI_703]
MGRPEEEIEVETVAVVVGVEAQQAQGRGGRPVLLSYNDIPEWYQDSKFILRGYRPESKSAYSCLASWVYLHNETVNIFSHLLPAIFFLAGEGLITWYFQAKYPNASIGDRLVFAFWLLSATICMGLSAGYHTLMNHSDSVGQLWLKFDFMGILILTLGDYVSGVYIGFYCERKLQIIYWSLIVSLCCLSIFILMSPRFQGLRWRALRTSVFIGTALSGLIPVIHGIALFGFPRMARETGIPYYLAEGVLLGIGVFFYATRIPECFKPGVFDIWGSSHQLFHIFVVFATAVHLVGILTAYQWHYHHQTCSIK